MNNSNELVFPLHAYVVFLKEDKVKAIQPLLIADGSESEIAPGITGTTSLGLYSTSLHEVELKYDYDRYLVYYNGKMADEFDINKSDVN